MVILNHLRLTDWLENWIVKVTNDLLKVASLALLAHLAWMANAFLDLVLNQQMIEAYLTDFSFYSCSSFLCMQETEAQIASSLTETQEARKLAS